MSTRICGVLCATTFVAVSVLVATEPTSPPTAIEEVHNAVTTPGPTDSSIVGFTVDSTGTLQPVDASQLDLSAAQAAGVPVAEVAAVDAAYETLVGQLEDFDESPGSVDLAAVDGSISELIGALKGLDLTAFGVTSDQLTALDDQIDLTGLGLSGADFTGGSFDQIIADGMAALQARALGTDGEPTSWNVSDVDVSTLGLDQFAASLQSLVDQTLGDIEGVWASTSTNQAGSALNDPISAIAFGPDGTVIDVGNFPGTMQQLTESLSPSTD